MHLIITSLFLGLKISKLQKIIGKSLERFTWGQVHLMMEVISCIEGGGSGSIRLPQETLQPFSHFVLIYLSYVRFSGEVYRLWINVFRSTTLPALSAGTLLVFLQFQISIFGSAYVVISIQLLITRFRPKLTNIFYNIT